MERAKAISARSSSPFRHDVSRNQKKPDGEQNNGRGGRVPVCSESVQKCTR